MSNIPQWSCEKFADETFSSAPVPGGGGVAALVGSIGAALAGMVCNLTTGKKKYAEYQSEIEEIIAKAGALRDDFKTLVEKDAEVFEPLSKAYGMPKDTPEQQAEKDRVMEECLRNACSVPLDIMRKCCEAIDIMEGFAEKGSKLALSDAGVGAILCRSALMGASLNVFINTSSMKDRAYAAEAEEEANTMLEKYTVKAEDIFNDVKERL
jgi:formiminotetrahydrofolate cyclodeaminase